MGEVNSGLQGGKILQDCKEGSHLAEEVGSFVPSNVE